MKIGIFGLGYVGLVNLACFSSLGNKVYGCDIKSQKVDLIKKGKSPIYEPQVEEMLSEGVERGLISASTSAELTIKETDISLICVGTPTRDDGSVNLNYTINTTIDIARIIKKEQKEYSIVYRSTIPPGTIENVVVPELEAVLGDSFDLVSISFLPEFLREGSAVNDFFNGARIVIGNDDGRHQLVKQLVSYNEQIPVEFTDVKTAEFVKYVDNAYHALKVAFANEVYTIGSAYEIDVQKANKIFLMDNVLNVSSYYLKPGLPFGGSCLPKDMRAINLLAKNKQVSAPLLNSVIFSNQAIQDRIFQRVIDTGVSKVMLFGLAFKENTDDVRESPLLQLAKDLVNTGKNVVIYDPLLNLQTLRIEQADIVKYISDDPACIGTSELLVVGKKGLMDFRDKVNDSSLIFNLTNENLSQLSNEVIEMY